ncbi:MAG TPA: hypothetical protein VGA69_10260 [Nitriliruptorales bacterium]
MTTVAVSPMLDTARHDALAAAERSGADIIEVSDLDRLRDVSRVFDRIWGRNGDSSLVPFELLRAMSHGGNYVAAAQVDGQTIGAAFGFRALHDGEPVLHSHILGVLGSIRSRGVGFALKQHQRVWCLERGLSTMTWTFDPLVRHNAYFNLSRLGADVAAYLPHFYGQMDDAINGGDSDRLLIRWDLESERAAAGARRDPLAPRAHDVDAAVALLTDKDGQPVLSDVDGEVVRCQVPTDIVALRRSDAEAAASWRGALRNTMSTRLADGYRVGGITRDGWYLLSRDSS